jgi:hypothetical protein
VTPCARSGSSQRSGAAACSESSSICLRSPSRSLTARIDSSVLRSARISAGKVEGSHDIRAYAAHPNPRRKPTPQRTHPPRDATHRSATHRSATHPQRHHPQRHPPAAPPTRSASPSRRFASRRPAWRCFRPGPARPSCRRAAAVLASAHAPRARRSVMLGPDIHSGPSRPSARSAVLPTPCLVCHRTSRGPNGCESALCLCSWVLPSRRAVIVHIPTAAGIDGMWSRSQISRCTEVTDR